MDNVVICDRDLPPKIDPGIMLVTLGKKEDFHGQETIHSGTDHRQLLAKSVKRP
jgi:hypothetical protein